MEAGRVAHVERREVEGHAAICSACPGDRKGSLGLPILQRMKVSDHTQTG
jgi:hypothetical protein